MTGVDPKLVYSGNKLLAVALPLAAFGWVGLLFGFQADPKGTYFGYLTAFAFVTSIALGALVLLMSTYLLGASWNVVLRRLNEVLVSVLPILAVLFIPLLFGLSKLYVWVDPIASFGGAELELIRHKQAYLNVPAFVARSFGYFLVWTLPAWLLWRWSLSRDRQGSSEPEHRVHGRERALSAALLPFVALALTFAGFDWLMSLQPLWTSTLFGAYYFAGGFVASFGALALLAWSAERAGMLEGLIRPKHFHALGRMMFAFTVVWANSALLQAMIFRMGRPEASEFYRVRLERGWDMVLVALVVGRFALPFLLLLSRDIKLRGGTMAITGAFVVLGHYVDMFWLVAPMNPTHGPFLTARDGMALLAVLGTATAYGALLLRGRPVVPVGDPVFARSVERLPSAGVR